MPSPSLPALDLAEVPAWFDGGGPEVLRRQMVETFGLPWVDRRIPGGVRMWDPPGWSEPSPLTVLHRWTDPRTVDEYGEVIPAPTPVTEYVRTARALSDARTAARTGDRDRKRLRDLSEAVQALSEPAQAEYEALRESLARWAASWPVPEPQPPHPARPPRRAVVLR